jgi:solute carrier family 25 (mitochondrial folate transporter), member 32
MFPSPDNVKSILRTHGIHSHYRGLGPTILACLPTWAIYVTVYDDMKGVFGEPHGQRGHR